MKERKPKNQQLLRTVERACDVLQCFRNGSELLRLTDVAARTNLDQSTIRRIVHTLVSKGLIEQTSRFNYRSRIETKPSPREWIIGYAAQTSEFAFTREVSDGILRTAEEKHVRLIMLDNRYSKTAAKKNTSTLIKERVDLAIEYQTDEKIAPVISSMYQEAGIPVIAIDIPHPRSTYFGADNYRAGVIGGRYLGKWARERWGGKVEQILLIEFARVGPVPAARLTGMLNGIREVLPEVASKPVIRLDGNAQFSRTLEVVRRHLRWSGGRRTLAGAINDPSALGAVRGFEEAGMAGLCAVMGQGGTIEARAELRRPASCLIGSVAYFPERYGELVVKLAIDILEKKHVAPAIFVEHRLITSLDVNQYYPNDPLLNSSELDSLLLQTRPYSIHS